MKHTKIALYATGYICQYIMPRVLFGLVVPYYHGTIAPGATGAGLVALCIALFFMYRKIEGKIESNCNGLWHGLLLSIFPITIWLILGIGIHRVLEFLNTLANYWWLSLIFIVIGRMCTTVADVLAERDDSNGQ